jgi:antitoxin HicB
MAQGRTPEEAVDRAYGAMRAWLTVALEEGIEIPEPRGAFSGQFLLRIPRGLHGELVRKARREGVSLNQFVSTTLAGSVGWGAHS